MVVADEAEVEGAIVIALPNEDTCVPVTTAMFDCNRWCLLSWIVAALLAWHQAVTIRSVIVMA